MICIHIVKFNGLQTVEDQITVLMQLQRAINDARRWIKTLSSEKIGHLKKCNNCICFINTNAHLFCDARSRLHVIRNDVEKVTLVVGGSTESVFTSWTCKYWVKCRLQKKGVTTQRFYKVKQRWRTILDLEEKMRWSLRQAWPFQRYYVLREASRASQQASICVYKAYNVTYF